jgi:hypothetical protein
MEVKLGSGLAFHQLTRGQVTLFTINESNFLTSKTAEGEEWDLTPTPRRSLIDPEVWHEVNTSIAVKSET